MPDYDEWREEQSELGAALESLSVAQKGSSAKAINQNIMSGRERKTKECV